MAGYASNFVSSNDLFAPPAAAWTNRGSAAQLGIRPAAGGANAQDEERAVCDCLNPFDVISVALARHLFFGALLILGDVPEVRGNIA